MKALLLALALLLAGCTNLPAADGPTYNDGDGTWQYVHGPHGENCLMYSVSPGSRGGLLAMSCDSVKPDR